MVIVAHRPGYDRGTRKAYNRGRGAVITRIGFGGVYYTIIIIRNPPK